MKYIKLMIVYRVISPRNIVDNALYTEAWNNIATNPEELLYCIRKNYRIFYTYPIFRLKFCNTPKHCISWILLHFYI